MALRTAHVTVIVARFTNEIVSKDKTSLVKQEEFDLGCQSAYPEPV